MKILNDSYWEILSPILEELDPPKLGRGRKRADTRLVLEGILWVCRTGARWQDMPRELPPYQTCHRRFQAWNRGELWEKILARLLTMLAKDGKIDLTEAFMDGSFSAAKKGALVLEKLKKAKAPRSWELQMAMVFLSPFAHMQPTPTKLNLLKKLLIADLEKESPKELLQTRPTTATRLTRPSKKEK